MLDFFLILLLLLKNSSEGSYMIVVSGKPSDFGTSETVSESWESCLASCGADDECIATYKISETQCQVFLFGSLTAIDKSYSGDIIGVKTELSVDECPATNPLLLEPVYSFENSDGQLYVTDLSIDDFQNYNLNYSILTCPANTKLFQRTTVVVCIGLFMFESPLCNNFAQGSALCKSENGTLTGPANSIEYEYIQAQSNSSYNTSNPGGYSYLVYWIDGVGTNTKYVYTFEDPTHDGIENYKFAGESPAYSGSNYCLCNPNPLGFYIADNLCSETYCCSSVCWRGALCQVPYATEVV